MNINKKLMAVAVALTTLVTIPNQAQAHGCGGGWNWGSFGAGVVGGLVGGALTRPYGTVVGGYAPGYYANPGIVVPTVTQQMAYCQPVAVQPVYQQVEQVSYQQPVYQQQVAYQQPAPQPVYQPPVQNVNYTRQTVVNQVQPVQTGGSLLGVGVNVLGLKVGCGVGY